MAGLGFNLTGMWIKGHKCTPHKDLDTPFKGNNGYELNQAKKICALSCDDRDDCFFANLYFSFDVQACALVGKDCGNWKTNTLDYYYIYKKGNKDG